MQWASWRAGLRRSRWGESFAPRAVALVLAASAIASAAGAASVQPKFLSVSITAPREVAGEVETWKIQFTIDTALVGGGYDFVATFPSSFSFPGGETCTWAGHTGVNTSRSGNSVRCDLGTTDLTGVLEFEFNISSTKNPTVSGQTTVFSLEFQDSTGATKASDSVHTVTIDPGALTSLTAWAPVRRAGEVETWSVNFTTANPVASNGNIHLDFPDDFVLSSGGASACSVSVGGSSQSGTTTTLNATARSVTCGLTAAVSATAAVHVEVSRLKNPPQSQWNSSTPLTVRTRNSANATHDEKSSTGIALLPHAFTAGPTQSSNSTRVNATGDHSFQFTPFNPWPANGHLRVSFPVGYSFNATGPSSMTVSVGGATVALASVTVNGQDVVGVRSGAGPVADASTPVNVTVTNVKNPNATGSTTSFAVTTYTGGGFAIDIGTAPGVTIAAASANGTDGSNDGGNGGGNTGGNTGGNGGGNTGGNAGGNGGGSNPTPSGGGNRTANGTKKKGIPDGGPVAVFVATGLVVLLILVAGRSRRR